MEKLGLDALVLLSWLLFGKVSLDIVVPLSWLPLSWHMFGKVSPDVMVPLSWLIFGKVELRYSGTDELADTWKSYAWMSYFKLADFFEKLG